jgi:hypothetical protein
MYIYMYVCVYPFTQNSNLNFKSLFTTRCISIIGVTKRPDRVSEILSSFLLGMSRKQISARRSLILAEDFHSVPHASGQMLEYCLKVGHGRFLPQCFSILYSLQPMIQRNIIRTIERVIKWTDMFYVNVTSTLFLLFMLAWWRQHLDI